MCSLSYFLDPYLSSQYISLTVLNGWERKGKKSQLKTQLQNLYKIPCGGFLVTKQHSALQSGKVPMGNKPLALSDSVTQITM